MNFITERNRIYLNNEDGLLLAEVTFPDMTDKAVNINHTFVDDSLRGQGIASLLMEEVVKKLQQDNKQAVLTCSYAVKWFEKNNQHSNLISSL